MKTKICILAKRFLLDHSGNSATEYAIIVVLISAAIIPVIHGIGSSLATKLAIAAGITLIGISPFGP
jgi:Flp pilus assembly pilin Flp